MPNSPARNKRCDRDLLQGEHGTGTLCPDRMEAVKEAIRKRSCASRRVWRDQQRVWSREGNNRKKRSPISPKEEG